jgi:hypothetical protein
LRVEVSTTTGLERIFLLVGSEERKSKHKEMHIIFRAVVLGQVGVNVLVKI